MSRCAAASSTDARPRNILADVQPSEPVVTVPRSSRLHHAAFDAHILGVHPAANLNPFRHSRGSRPHVGAAFRGSMEWGISCPGMSSNGQFQRLAERYETFRRAW